MTPIAYLQDMAERAALHGSVQYVSVYWSLSERPGIYLVQRMDREERRLFEGQFMGRDLKSAVQWIRQRKNGS